MPFLIRPSYADICNMNRNLYIVLVSVVVLLTGITACTHGDKPQNLKESSPSTRESHNFGQNCLSCHQDAGSEAAEEGRWTVAGSVSNDGSSSQPTNAGGSIELWTSSDRQGTMIYSIPIDQKGNFYTNKTLAVSNGVYPVIVNGSSGQWDSMSSVCTSGGCNGCHGNTEEFIELPD